ncbi:hypothetical protein HNQ93_003907 [Hymenobacter luteus]|uniref:Outer membrane protein beta-barrel domain-containing protein n=2 Tax=Hymenobacter TaxID=89966 RepID=A0A7W9T405_9BACT|nr:MULTISPECIES: hypothetical protein [Hymenobacter]MBB4603009.1 hypothetical protein [Hymenobacter latericoloratus]MBB6061031.1 hypothetical protein [Hymenobacter luteus]
MLRFYFLLLCTLGSFAAFAQGIAGYVVMPAGDTLRGYVKEQSLHLIEFYPLTDSKPQYFRPSQVRAYGFGASAPHTSRPVRLRSGQDSLCFVQAVLSGPASLYGYFADSTKLMLAPPTSDTLYELTARNWHLLFGRYLGNCPSLDMTDKRVLNLAFNQRSVRDLIIRYNQCIAPAWQPTRLNTSVTEPSLVLQAGVVYSILTDRTRIYATSPDLRPGALISAELRHTRSSGWWVSAGGTLQHLRGGLQPYNIYTGTSLYTTTVTESYQLNSVALLGSFGRNFGQPGKIRPFAFLSVGGNLFFSSYYRIHQENSHPLFPAPADADTNQSGEFGLQASGGAGLLFPLRPQREVQVHFSYGQNALVFSPDFLRTHVFTLQVGYVLVKK